MLTFIVGDVFDGLASLEPNSVDLIVTSPPFLALRSYLPADHEHKAKELGSEATPGEFIDRLLDVVEACDRVLAPHGSLVFELGDTYAGASTEKREAVLDGSARWGGENGAQTLTGFRGGTVDRHGNGWPLDKSKVLIPQLFAIALAYGFNPLTGRQTEPWRVRNTVAWCRPNPPVGRDGDKFRPATSFLTVATKARDRYWDGDAVRVPMTRPEFAQYEPITNRVGPGRAEDGMKRASRGSVEAGAPLLDYWVIPTAPYKGSHYATYPPDLVVPLVKAMCPSRVCRVCGKPSTRIVRGGFAWDEKSGPREFDRNGKERKGTTPRQATDYETLGWSDCGHDDCRPGMVLDPFAGSGTTLAVASGHGFDCIGLDLDSRNADLARQRCGMFLEIR